MLASLLCKGAPYTVPISPTAFDYGAAYVSLIAKTRASLRDWQQHATTYVTVGALNISSKVESPVFRAYPLARLANVSDGIFIMSYDMNKGHATCAGPNSPINLLREYVGGYSGTVLVVSHDEPFVSAAATSIVEVAGGKLQLYKSTSHDKYLAARRERQAQAVSAVESWLGSWLCFPQ